MPPHADVLQWEHLPFPKSLRDFEREKHRHARCSLRSFGAWRAQ